MGYLLDETGFSHLIENLKKSYRIFAPVLKKGQGRHLDTDVVLYDEVNEAGEIELLKKSDYAFKEAMTPLSETLFFFTEKETKLADIDERPVLVFLRSCDLHALSEEERASQIRVDWLSGGVRELFLCGHGKQSDEGRLCVLY